MCLQVSVFAPALNTLGKAGKAKFRRGLIKQLVEEGGMSRLDADNYAKTTYP